METSSQAQVESGIPVLGLLGPPGAGKSYVARVFGGLGAAVIDADALARAALDTPEAVRTLVGWWGRGVLGPDDAVDRAAVGRQVFGESADQRTARARLEELIHPRVHAARAAARAAHLCDPKVVAVIEDCPLLLERGLEEGCDALVFIDTPRAVRLERVTRDRGWDAAELARREKSQLPLDIKRRRADYVMDGVAEASAMSTVCRAILSSLGTSTDVVI